MNCVEQISANIELNCEHPLVKGYTGRALLIPYEAIANRSFVLTEEALHPKMFKAEIGESPIGALITPRTVENVTATPFNGSSTTATDDDGFRKYTKTLTILVPLRGAEAGRKVIDPIVKSGNGFVLLVEKVDQAGDGSYEFIGLEKPMKVIDPSTVQRTETENGGAWSMTLQTTESYPEAVFVAGTVSQTGEVDYLETRAAFEEFLV